MSWGYKVYPSMAVIGQVYRVAHSTVCMQSPNVGRMLTPEARLLCVGQTLNDPKDGPHRRGMSFMLPDGNIAWAGDYLDMQLEGWVVQRERGKCIG